MGDLAAVEQTRCGPQEGPEIDALHGQVTDAVLAEDREAKRAEEEDLISPTLAYHYFDGTAFLDEYQMPLEKVIWASRRVGSRIQCLTVEEIVRSVQDAPHTQRPHYGDGAYCTLHASYPEAHHAVVIAHGMNPAVVLSRAVIWIEQPQHFRKFSQTGGVARSRPSGCLERGRKVFVGEATGEIRLLRIERYQNGRWERVSL